MGAGQQLKQQCGNAWICFEDMLALYRDAVKHLDGFMQATGKLKLRGYQREVALRVIDSVCNNRGHTIIVQFPRQSGKNELQAQLEAYLLTLFCIADAEIVKVSPTWKPQTLNAMRRLQRVLERNLCTRGRWVKESGYIYRIRSARIFFLSGSPTTSVVGATASTLLQCDEAQDILISKWDKDFSPMAASTNATRVFWGTAWTSKTLLARERRAAQAAQEADGMRRVFVIDADQVAEEVPEYGAFVREQVAKLGRSHPMIKTQFYGEEIDAEGGMFPPARLAMMRGEHGERSEPAAGCTYAALLDVAGTGRRREFGRNRLGKSKARQYSAYDCRGRPGYPGRSAGESAGVPCSASPAVDGHKPGHSVRAAEGFDRALAGAVCRHRRDRCRSWAEQLFRQGISRQGFAVCVFTEQQI
jgi:hypothetical protein